MQPSTSNGTGAIVRTTGAKLTTPDIGAATATSITTAALSVTALSNGKIPYHVSDASGLADGPTKTDVDSAVSLKHAQQHAITSTSDHTSTATSGQILKADTNGLPVDATNTDADVASAVSLKHPALTIDGTSPLSLSTQAISLKNDAAAAITEVDTGTLANSDTVVPTSKAVLTAIGSGYKFVPCASFYAYRTATRISSTPRTATVSSISGQEITLTANEAYRFGYWDSMTGKIKMKICNTTKSAYAWVTNSTAANKLTIQAGDDISGWQLGDNLTTAYDGASSTWIECRIVTATIPAGAKVLVGITSCYDTGTIVNAKGFGLASTDLTSGGIVNYVQVSGITNLGFAFVSLDDNLGFMSMESATGTDTMKSFFFPVGYHI